MEVSVLEGAGLSVENPDCNGAVKLGRLDLVTHLAKVTNEKSAV